MSMVNIEALCFILLLLIASFYDLRTHQIPNSLSLVIAGMGLIHNSPFTALIGLFITCLPYLLAAIFSGGKIGGGDIKLMAACGVVLGPIYGTLQSILGLTLVLLFALGAFFRHGIHSTRQMALPLAPFLTVGGIAAYILSH
ncbi:prepilin peptidase [Paenibacillus massiliensis]|uniref:prepilin peptidase n=1 Tax=Paenibacillus massiliensis TaxID=225917 RepID=UPI0003823209|nr:prepilin peptidase [Paenibacillus massiliensis]